MLICSKAPWGLLTGHPPPPPVGEAPERLAWVFASVFSCNNCFKVKPLSPISPGIHTFELQVIPQKKLTNSRMHVNEK